MGADHLAVANLLRHRAVFACFEDDQREGACMFRAHRCGDAFGIERTLLEGLRQDLTLLITGQRGGDKIGQHEVGLTTRRVSASQRDEIFTSGE